MEMKNNVLDSQSNLKHSIVKINLNENISHENIDFEQPKKVKSKTTGHTYVPSTQIEVAARLIGKPSILATRSSRRRNLVRPNWICNANSRITLVVMLT